MSSVPLLVKRQNTRPAALSSGTMPICICCTE